MTNYKTQFPLGWCIFILNLPFIFLALKKMGKAFVAFTFYAVTVLSIGVSLMPVWLNHKHVSDPFLACIFGGLILGAGVGLVLRSNSSLDGTEILSISLSKNGAFPLVKSSCSLTCSFSPQQALFTETGRAQCIR